MTIPAIPESWQSLRDWATWAGVMGTFAYSVWRYILRPRVVAPVKAFGLRVVRGLDIVDGIQREMQPNGGGSIKDQLHRIEESCDRTGGQVSAIIETANEPIMRADPKGAAVDVNRALELLAGCSRRELMGWGWCGRIHPEDRDAVITEWEASVAHRRFFVAEFRFEPVTGPVLLVRMVATPMRAPSSQALLGWHSVFTPQGIA